MVALASLTSVGVLPVGGLQVGVLHFELAELLYGEGDLANCRCGRCTCSDAQYYHAGVSQYNLQGRPNSTRSDIEDLVAMI